MQARHDLLSELSLLKHRIHRTTPASAVRLHTRARTRARAFTSTKVDDDDVQRSHGAGARIYAPVPVRRRSPDSHTQSHHLYTSFRHEQTRYLRTFTSSAVSENNKRMSKDVSFYDLKAELPGADKFYNFDELKVRYLVRHSSLPI